jgi:hypothetical protein
VTVEVSKGVTAFAIFTAVGGWAMTAITNWDKTPWGRQSASVAPTTSGTQKCTPLVNHSGKESTYFVYGRIEDGEGRPMEGVTVKVTELLENGAAKEINSQRSSDTGTVSFNVPLSRNFSICGHSSSPKQPGTKPIDIGH